MRSPGGSPTALELCGEQDIDPTDAIYDHFFALSPDARDLMGHSDGPMRGRMAAQTFDLLTDETLTGEDGYLRWEVDNHVGAYGVRPDIYPLYFEAVKRALRDALGSSWEAADETAWDRRIAELQADIDAHVAAAVA